MVSRSEVFKNIEAIEKLTDAKLTKSGWGNTDTDGPHIIRGRMVRSVVDKHKTEKQRSFYVDYVLVYKGIKLALIEVKSEKSPIFNGIADAKKYAGKIGLETAYFTNGKIIYCICLKTGTECAIEGFLTPEELWVKTNSDKENISEICKCLTKKIKLADGKNREIHHIPSTPFLGDKGKSISVEKFLIGLFDELNKIIKSEEDLKLIWGHPVTRKNFIEKLNESGFSKDSLINLQKLINAEKSDLFDVLIYVLNSDIKPITREARVSAAKDTIFSTINNKQKEFIEFVLNQYIYVGVSVLDQDNLPRLLTNQYQSIQEALDALGDANNISSLFVDFQKYLYLHV